MCILFCRPTQAQRFHDVLCWHLIFLLHPTALHENSFVLCHLKMISLHFRIKSHKLPDMCLFWNESTPCSPTNLEIKTVIRKWGKIANICTVVDSLFMSINPFSSLVLLMQLSSVQLSCLLFSSQLLNITVSATVVFVQASNVTWYMHNSFTIHSWCILDTSFDSAIYFLLSS